METWIRRACRQRVYRQLILWVLMTAAIVAANLANVEYWNNFFHGPYQLTAAELGGITDPENFEKQFIVVNGDKVVPSGIQVITTETENGVKQKSYVSSEYYVLLMKDKRLLVVQSHGEPPLQIVGELKQLPTSVVDSIFSDPADSDLKERAYPFYLSTIDAYRIPGNIALGVMLTYIAVAWIFAGRAWRYARDISIHPVVKRIESRQNGAEISMLSEYEMQSVIRFKKVGLLITENFVVDKGLFTFNLFPFHDLLWAYKKVTTRSINFLPVAKTSQAVLIFDGGNFFFPARKKVVDDVLIFAASRAPWAIAGHSEELAKIFKKDPVGFRAAVEERRGQMK